MIIFFVYNLEKVNLIYMIDEGCMFVGNFIIEMLDILKGLNWGVCVYMIFSGIEVVVIVVDRDDFEKIVIIMVNFLL